jgi:acetylornithine/succinyldiaminopimelate/putrescine aminotransferase
VRGLGYLVGLQLTSDPAPYVAACVSSGLLVPSAGGNVIRLLPPLTATPGELAQAVEMLPRPCSRPGPELTAIFHSWATCPVSYYA